ncbi:MAG: PHP domain-containing protein, partial [Erysipelotrichaceae bacterium]|nr:PHP domain-containing protein [Erysipelotrichaceae bacterium]
MPVLDVVELLSKTQCSSDFLNLFDQAEITDLTYYSSSKTLHMTLLTKETLVLEAALQTKERLKALLPCEFALDLRCRKNTLGTVEINKYFNYFQKEVLHRDMNELFLTVKHSHIECLCPNDEVKDEAQSFHGQLTEFLRSYGIDFEIQFVTRQVELVNKTMALPQVEAPVQVVVKENTDFKRPKKLKYEDYEKVTISQLKDEIDQIQFTGTVFDINTITTKKGTLIQTLMVFDDTDALSVKRFEGRYTSKEDIESIKKGDTCNFYGRMAYDTFAKEVTFTAEQVIKTEGKKKKQDTAEHKRVELHLHSNMSEMDGVCEVKDLISQAFDYGHKAVAITDHMVVQAFPQAQSACGACRKKDPERDFKVLYGVEMNMVDDHLTILRNSVDTKLDEAVYCIYDLETTGLSNNNDHTIEFGGVKLKNGEIIETMQTFIKPPVPINAFIAEKTNITNAVVANAPEISEVIDQILDFIGDSVLVAHNATFDYGFINAELKRLGREPLKNPVIDTLDLARAIHKDRRTYRLGNIARHYRVAYDEDVAHRADYDAKVLSEVFMLMIQDCKKRGALTISDLDLLQSDDAYIKVMKRHITILAKNKPGLKRLFQLITTSHTKTLALFGKANSKSNGEEFMAEPRILRTELMKDRENLLFGTACYNGEIFEIAANRSQEELEEALSFYDYVEIQPLENYRPQVENHVVPSFDRLKDILSNIVKTAEKLGLIVVATGDVHYNTPDQKLLRDIYIATQGIGGVRHPLHIYDAERRKKTIHPDQHFRTTDEMLECFAWMGKEKAHELVVENTNKIADLCEFIKPVHDKLYTPVIDGADQKLTDI